MLSIRSAGAIIEMFSLLCWVHLSGGITRGRVVDFYLVLLLVVVCFEFLGVPDGFFSTNDGLQCCVGLLCWVAVRPICVRSRKS